MSTVEPAPGTKRCPRCGETKPLDAFNRNATRPDGRQTYCRECGRAASRERANKGLCKDCDKPAEPGRRRCVTHLAANRAAQRPRNRARIADGRHATYLRAWRERNREAGWCYNGGRSHGPATRGVLCAACAERRVAEYRRVLREFTEILADQGIDYDGRCQLCGLAEATEVDHVQPRSHGGPDDDPHLLRWVCRSCNASRGNNTSWVPPITAWDIEEQRAREEGR